MKLRNLSEVLAAEHLKLPHLEALTPSIDDYSVAILQPRADLIASAERIAHRDAKEAARHHTKFLNLCIARGTRLVVAPEYCVNWNAVSELLLGGRSPGDGALWVLGCESITPQELGDFTTKIGDTAVVIHETLPATAMVGRVFFDPVLYVFKTQSTQGQEKVVVLVQFKTYASVDPGHIEVDSLIRGETIYVLSREGVSVKLTTLLCSDAFNMDDQTLGEIHDSALILHLQLNRNPRQPAYCRYRKWLFEKAGERTEVLCVNWASDVRVGDGTGDLFEPLTRMGGSAWYLRSTHAADETHIVANHRLGLYYAFLRTHKWNALFLNYEPGAYFFEASKVWHHGVDQVQSRRHGPRVRDVFRWHAAQGALISGELPGDGFVGYAEEFETAQDCVAKAYQSSPISVERLSELSLARISEPHKWHEVFRISTLQIDLSEVLNRLSFTQDPDSKTFRDSIAQQWRSFHWAITSFQNWPNEFISLREGFAVEWDPLFPNSNVHTTSGERATIVFMGDSPTSAQLRDKGKLLRTVLMHAADSALRLGLLYSKHGKLFLWRHEDDTLIDVSSRADPTEYTRGDPR